MFHDECMKRWLLVRDGCPICRRSYLDGVVEEKIQLNDDDGGGAVDEDEGESRDLESGGGGGNDAVIATEEE